MCVCFDDSNREIVWRARIGVATEAHRREGLSEAVEEEEEEEEARQREAIADTHALSNFIIPLPIQSI